MKIITALFLEEIFAPIKNQLKAVEETIIQELNGAELISQEMKDYLLPASGKLLRPALVLLSAGFSGNDNFKNIKLATASELIHTATLVHDDIIDQADRRRGKESVWQRWGNSQAVLLGDFLLAKAFNILAQIDEQRITLLYSRVANYMCQGQMYQLGLRYCLDTNTEDYLKIVENKTASFMAACCQAGGILGESGSEELNNLTNYGRNLGMAFQIIDDNLDYLVTPEQAGKTTGNDLKDGEITLPLIHCLDNMDREEKKIFKIRIGNFWNKEIPFSQIQNYIFRTHSLEYTQKIADQFIQKAIVSLANFPASPNKESLTNLAEYTLNRKS